MIEIVAAGALATVQDLGRIRLAQVGVPRSGAFDRRALRLANRLVGNPDDAASIEATLGIALRFDSAATIACTGARCDGVDWNTAVTLAAGTTITLRPPRTGLRSYVAVRGGIDVPPVLGSRSTDVLSDLGHAPLRAGDRLPVGPEPPAPVLGETARPTDRLVSALSVTFGPRDDWFTSAALDVLTSATWTVRAESNRVGLRLDGPALERRITTELASEPTLPGALQVPPDGRPILLGPDAPVTGGYPVIAVVDDAGFDVAAQLRPGDEISFTSTAGAGS